MPLTKSRHRMLAGAPLVPIDRGAAAGGGVDDRAVLAACDAAAAYIDLSPGTYRVASNITLTKVVRFAPGAILQPDVGVTITLSGEIEAGAWQIFDCSALNSKIVGPVRNRLVLPEWWGAAPDTASDQSGKIQAAITFAEGGARTLYLRNGMWRCDATLYMRQPAGIVGDPGIPAQGVTTDNSTLDFSNAPAASHGLVIGRDIDFPLDGIVLKDFAIYRATQVATGSGCCGLLLRSVMQAEVHNVQSWRWDKDFSIGGSPTYPSAQCEFQACRGQYAGTNHWEIWSAIDCTYERCFGGGGPAEYCVYIFSNISGGFSSGQPNAQHFDRCIFVSPDARNGIRILHGFYHLIENCVFEEMDEAGILLAVDTTDISLLTVNITECGFNNCGDGIASVGHNGNFRVTDCRIEATSAADQHGIIVDSDLVSAVERDIVISGNNIKHTGAATTGIFLQHVKGAVVANNRIICDGAAGATAGITLGTDTASCRVINNRSQTTFASADGISDNGTGNVLTSNSKY
jgi:hypothetical protein